LGTDGLFDGVVAAAGRCPQALLSEECDASEPGCVIGEDIGAVCVILE
jgi:hypothetical protein